MRKHLLIFSYVSFSVLSFYSQAQRLAGLTSAGGGLGGGIAYRVNTDGSHFTDIKDFVSYPQQAAITLGRDGVVYGITKAGGTHGHGTLFKMNTDGTNYSTLFSFDLAVGGTPGSRLIHGSNGLLYGVTNEANVNPRIFSIKTDGSAFTVLKTLTLLDTDGNLSEGQDGRLYLSSQSGAIVALNKDGTGYTTLHTFDYPGGALGGLTQDSDGNLYGASDYGTIFTLRPDGSGFTILHEFIGSDGSVPRSKLLLGLDGNLYGGTSAGGANGLGVIYSINPNGTGFKKIYDLDYSDGQLYDQTLIQDASGFLYCATDLGGPKGAGTVFRIKPDGSLHQKIYDFEHSVALIQNGRQIIVANNALIGVNITGATHGAGNIFTIQFDGTGYQSLLDFGGTSGSNPYGSLIVGIDSLVYGTTLSGGNNNLGSIFSMDGNGNNFKKLYDFDEPGGALPYQGLTQGPDGTLYVTASRGGTQGVGTLFKINPNGTGFTKLVDFDSNKGGVPFAAPLVGQDGKLYGACYQGGANGLGTIYSVNTDGTGFTKLLDFDNTNGAAPYASLIQDPAGKLYGATYSGGTGFGGVVFTVNPDGTNFTKLHEFNFQDQNGAQPFASLLLGKDGVLYGVNAAIGGASHGSIFSINRDGSNFKKIYDFNGAGDSPQSLIQLEDGNLYGMNVGYYSGGVVYSIHTDGSGFVKLCDLPNALMGLEILNNLVALKLKKQSINFSSIKDVVLTDPGFTLSASSSSGSPVIFSSNSSHVQLTQNSVSIKEPGKVIITASQDGDGVYDKASTQQSFCIYPPKPSITIGTSSSSLTLQSSATTGNQWFKDGTLIPNATGQIFQVTDIARFGYTVQASVEGCVGNMSDPLVIAGVEKTSAGSELQLFPNPVSTLLNVQLNSFAKNEPANIQVYDVLGRRVSQTTISDTESASVNVSQYENGAYILKVIQGQQVAYARFVKH